MNYIKLGKILGKIMILESFLMLAPLSVSLIYNESFKHILAFIVPILGLAVIGLLLQIPKPRRNTIYQKEGFAVTALAWLVFALSGAVPFVINGVIPNFIVAFFEIMSGFTTTGASIVTDIEALSHSTLFWRSFSHWIGGMGILVFVLIFIPESNEGSSMHLLRAESPGPQVGKIVSKMKVTTRILYLIYLGLTVLEIVILMFDKPIAGHESEKFFYSLLASFGSAGTGGFGFINGGIEQFNPFSQYVIAIFLLLFGCNFTLYYLLLIRKIKTVLKSEELRVYIFIVIVAVALICLSLYARFDAFPQTYTNEEIFRHSLFQTASILTTTGYSTTDFNLWPVTAQTVLVILMFIGGMAGSTGGGIKVSRFMIAFKGMFTNIRKLIDPHYVPKTKIEGKTIEQSVINSVFAFFTLYLFILLITTLIISFDPINGQSVTIASDAGEYVVKHGFLSNLTAVISCSSNIGPGLEAVGPYGSFAGFSGVSKLLLSFVMMIGRLEILPVLILFSPRTWKRI